MEINNLLIRRGVEKDSVQIANLLLLAMEDIAYLFIGIRDREIALGFLNELVQQVGNQYSFNNNWVIEENGEIIATALIYDGGKLYELRKPVKQLIEGKYKKVFSPEDETQEGEYYIDCIAVREDQQGKGLGSKIIEHLIEEYNHKKGVTLGLLVDLDNPNAKKLYERLGFVVLSEKKLLGKSLEHMQKK